MKRTFYALLPCSKRENLNNNIEQFDSFVFLEVSKKRQNTLLVIYFQEQNALPC